MDDMLKVAIFIIALIGAGIGAYAGVTVVSVMKRRFEGKLETTGFPPEELDAIHARLDAADALEARVAELEERADFAERMLVEKGEPERLSRGPVVDNQH